MNKNDIRIKANKAALYGDLELLQRLFEENGEKLIESDEMGLSLLHYASRSGNIQTIEWLIEKGFDLNVVDRFGGSPLYSAVNTHQKEAAEFLKSRGAKLKIPRANKMVSYFQFSISAVCILIMVFILIKGNFTFPRIILLIIVISGAVLGISEGIKGLLGKDTFANS